MANKNLYFAVNFIFAVLVIGSLLVHDSLSIHPAYLILLFAICSSAMIGMQRLNDRYALLAVFSGVYFLFYGVGDLSEVIFGKSTLRPDAGAFLTTTEAVILLGALMAHLGYRAACAYGVRAGSLPLKDWPESSMVIAGGALWAVCSWMAWQFKVHIVVSTLSEDVSRGLGGLNNWQAAAFILAILLQPLGILIAAYAQCKFKRAYLTPVLIAMVAFQFFMGFVTDIKSDALTGVLIVLITKALVDGKAPKSWLIMSVVIVAVAFPVLQANRAIRGESGTDRNDAFRNIGQIIDKAIETSKDKSRTTEEQQNFFERLSMVGSVDVIVKRTGKDVDFQGGYTLIPLATALIPRIIWPTKLDVQTGRVMNKEFQISPVEDTYISPSHLGELYWNFGWPGVIVGMLAIGMLFGFIGGRFNFEKGATLTNLMIAMVTIRLVIIGFEGTIAVQYSVWLRSMLAIGLLHVILARVQTRNVRRPQFVAQASAGLPATAPTDRFSNLMR